MRHHLAHGRRVDADKLVAPIDIASMLAQLTTKATVQLDMASRLIWMILLRGRIWAPSRENAPGSNRHRSPTSRSISAR